MAKIQRKESGVESGFQAGEVRSPDRQTGRSANDDVVSGIGDRAAPQSVQVERPAASERSDPRPAAPDAEAPKKRYYSPREVMQKKGCIGCGGMILPLLLIALAIIIAIL